MQSTLFLLSRYGSSSSTNGDSKGLKVTFSKGQDTLIQVANNSEMDRNKKNIETLVVVVSLYDWWRCMCRRMYAIMYMNVRVVS